MYKNQKIIVVAPCYNEAQKIGLVVKRIQEMRHAFVDEILVVDDGSSDDSALICKNLGASVISLPKVMGVGHAIREGIVYAKKNNYPLIVIIAGNNKDEPNEIPLLISKVVDEGFDFVQGSRYLKKSNFGDFPLYRKFATKLHPLLFSLFVGKKVTESTNGFRAFKTSIFENPSLNLNQDWLDQYELEPYLYYKTITLGFKTTEVPCTKIYPPKKLGQTKMIPLISWWSILRPLFYLKFGIKK